MMYKILFALTFVACVIQNATEGKPLAADDVALTAILETGDDATLEFNLDHLALTERQKRDLLSSLSSMMAGDTKSIINKAMSMFAGIKPKIEEIGKEFVNVAKSLLAGKMDWSAIMQLAMKFMPGS